ncbi:hypothetical protein OB13_04120 [Pontibacter sp. HJ8]
MFRNFYTFLIHKFTGDSNKYKLYLLFLPAGRWTSFWGNRLLISKTIPVSSQYKFKKASRYTLLLSCPYQMAIPGFLRSLIL